MNEVIESETFFIKAIAVNTQTKQTKPKTVKNLAHKLVSYIYVVTTLKLSHVFVVGFARGKHMQNITKFEIEHLLIFGTTTLI